MDGFAGPWKAKSAALEDTSIAIGLDALEDAVKTWSEQGARFDVEAAFVEKDVAFGAIWPELLEILHMTRTELAQVAWSLHVAAQLVVTNIRPRERSVKDDHVLGRA